MRKIVEHRCLQRSRVLLVTGILGWIFIEGRLVQIQLTRSAELARDVVVDRTEYIVAQRGDIRDRHGLPLAVSVLAAQNERDLALRGPYGRDYPMGDATGLVTGIVGRADPYGFVGKEGVELQYEPLLRGDDGLVRYIISGSGRVCTFEPLRIDRLPEPGTPVSLTIDAVYQALAHVEAEALRARVDARWAGILIMRPATGEILAAAASPSVDPEDYQPGATTANPLWTRQFEPGSSFKIVVLATALERGLLTPETMINCENGTWVTPARTWHDTSPLGVVSLATAVAKSSNIAAAKLGMAVGPADFIRVARDLGFGEKTSPHLRAEATGYLQQPDPRRRSALAAMAMGQGLSVTGVQLLNAFCCIANGGQLMQPLLAYGGEGITPTPVRRALTPATSRTLTHLLRGVVDGGTGAAARHPCIAAAGKTGTAQVAGRGGVGYIEGAYVATFAGFFPAEAPQVAVLVIAAEPRGSYYGGQVCAPVFRRVIDLMISAPGGCLYPSLAASLSSAPRSGWVSAPSEVARG